MISAGSLPKRADGNRRYYERRRVGAHYARKAQLNPPEAEILSRYAAEIRGARILDLGVGGGRTTSFLRELSGDYVGIDYSPKMVERCRARYPSANIQLMDARDLSAFPDGHFDFVLFSKAGIDAVGHEDRLTVLREVHRTLKDEGLFVFSSHNRNALVPKPWDLAHFDVNPLSDPVRFAKRILSYPVGIANYVRNSRRSHIEDEYCILVDSGDMYSLVHYRISATAQRRQLERAGFCEVEAVDLDGRTLSDAEWEAADDPSIHYVCRKASS
ncbi:MAG TPA: methyltransferase domain-containing protein [Sphingomicrobium sp.]|nr:methyltransferase domain-containing protein [Sphingomicrobium sp.]